MTSANPSATVLQTGCKAANLLLDAPPLEPAALD